MDFVIQALTAINIGELVAIALIGWFFYARLESKMQTNIAQAEARSDLKFNQVFSRIDQSEAKSDLKFNQMQTNVDLKFNQVMAAIGQLDTRMDKLEGRIEHIGGKLTDLDKRIFGIEAILHMKDCCVLKADSQLKKAQ